LLSPEQWFSRGHSHNGGHYDDHGFWRVEIKSGKFIWAPPPGAADIAVEELRKASIKRRDCTHVFLCPRLLTPQWRRHLNKACDLVLFMGAESEIWPVEMFEPLTIGLVFPFLSVRPWQIRGTLKMLSLGQTMSGMLKDTNLVTGDLLRKLCEQKMWCGECYTSHPTIIFHVKLQKQREGFEGDDAAHVDGERVQRAWGNKHRALDEYLTRRDDDHLLVPFECDLCIFRKLRRYDPMPTSEQDKLLLASIRRI
jgi:hypothetical protein